MASDTPQFRDEFPMKNLSGFNFN